MSATVQRSLLIVAALAGSGCARHAPSFDLRAAYTKREVMVPMRDGVRLFTSIYAPRDTAVPHPILLVRTPYGCAPYGPDAYVANLSYAQQRYAERGYILVTQDVRGRWMSDGSFEQVRPVIEHPAPGRTDETTDTYDTVEWLLHHVPGNNGRVGVKGTSYPGFYAEMAAIHAHPAVKAVAPQAPVTEWMGGDDFVHHGALLEAHAVDGFYFLGFPRAAPTTNQLRFLDHRTDNGYAWFLTLGSLAHVDAAVYHDSVAFWDSLLAHPHWDAFWAARSARPHLTDLTPALLWVGGWFDTENQWGALHGYAAAVAQSPATADQLVMGPWYHGQWNTAGGDSLGDVAWGQATARFYTDSIEVPFFDHYLRDGPAPRAFTAAVFDTGRRAWSFVNRWPPAATPTSFYLGAGGALTTAAPAAAAADSGFDQYVSDPARPVPYTAEVTEWYDHAFMIEDQRFADHRADVLVYRSAPLDSDLTVAGPIGVDLEVSTSGTDQDFAVKLIDVFPDSGAAPMAGYELPVRIDLMRGKYRDNPEHPDAGVPFTPGQVTPVRFTMNDVDHTFRRGHRIMVQVQSTLFPMFDRNPGRYMNIFQAADADFQPTTQRVYHSAAAASRLILPVVR